MNNTLPLSIVCNVAVSVSPVAAANPTFNQGLIVGNSTVIPSVGGTSPRIREYSSLAQMSTDGFTTANPEFLAAELYFGQTPTPTYLWIGRQDATALLTVAVNATAGTGYLVGDVLTVVQSGGSLGQVKVTSIGTAGVVTGVAPVSGFLGTGYAIATGLTTTGGTGTGCLVNISAIGETALTALQSCRAASPNWWGCLVTTAVAADHVAIAGWVQAVTPQACYFFTTADVAVVAGTSGNVLATLQAANYSRVFGVYSTVQAGSFPANAYAAAAALGKAMGLNTGLANSNFTLKFKVLTGIAAEPLTLSEISTIEGLNGNLYLSYANVYSWLEQSTVSDGQFLDEILNIDMLASDIQYSVVNLLISVPSVPHTNAGEAQLMQAVNGACERAVSRGFIAPGTWLGQTVLNLTSGAPLPKGYLTQAQSLALQSSGDRAARKAMPIYVALNEAGSMHSITIGVYVER
jgi:hypothetical protein